MAHLFFQNLRVTYIQATYVIRNKEIYINISLMDMLLWHEEKGFLISLLCQTLLIL